MVMRRDHLNLWPIQSFSFLKDIWENYYINYILMIIAPLTPKANNQVEVHGLMISQFDTSKQEAVKQHIPK